MIISTFACSWEESGFFFGIFDDIETMKKEYFKIKNDYPGEDPDDGPDYVAGECRYKKNRQMNKVFKMDGQYLLLVEPIKNKKFSIEMSKDDNLSKKDKLLIFVELQSKYEIECIYLLHNRYSYSENIDFLTYDEFEQHCPGVNLGEFRKSKQPERFFSPDILTRGKFDGNTPQMAASLSFTKLLKNALKQKT